MPSCLNTTQRALGPILLAVALCAEHPSAQSPLESIHVARWHGNARAAMAITLDDWSGSHWQYADTFFAARGLTVTYGVAIANMGASGDPPRPQATRRAST